MNIFYQTATLYSLRNTEIFFARKNATSFLPYMSFCKWQIYTLKHFIIHMVFKHKNDFI